MDDIEGLGLPEIHVILTCFRCGRDIEPEERTFSISVACEFSFRNLLE
jgi:hypothetical protein